MKKNCFRLSIFCIGTTFSLELARARQTDILKLLPAYGELPRTYWEIHHWQIISAIVAVAIITAIVLFFLLRPKRIVIEAPEIVARRELEKLRERKEDGAVVIRASRILKHFILREYQLPPDELTTTEFQAFLKNCPPIKPGLAEITVDFLRRCDRSKFAPASSPAPMNAASGALDILEKVVAQREPIKPVEGQAVVENK